MGLIKAAAGAIGGGLGDAWLETVESAYMGPEVITAPGVSRSKDDRRNSNTTKTPDTISNGSIIHVGVNQCMLLIDGGKIIDYTAEPGYFKVDHSSMPSIMNGELGEWVKESFNRFRFSGSTPLKQQAYYINLQEIRGIKFGTPSPVSYFDNTYNAELFLRAFGTYTIRVVDPILFYREVADHDATASVTMQDVNEQYRNEFLTAFQTALNRFSREGERIVYINSHGQELADYMQEVLDDKWRKERGMVVENVAIASISYDEESRKLVEMRNKGAMLGDPSIREGYVQGSIARGLEAAGSNEAGAGQTFMGMGVGMNAMGQGMGQFSQTNAQQMAEQTRKNQEASGGVAGTASGGAGAAAAGGGVAGGSGEPGNSPNGVASNGASASDRWICPECNHENSGKFCSNCGRKKPEAVAAHCPNCGQVLEDPTAKFCSNCGHKLTTPSEETSQEEK